METFGLMETDWSIAERAQRHFCPNCPDSNPMWLRTITGLKSNKDAASRSLTF